MSRADPVPVQLWPLVAAGTSAALTAAFVAGDPLDCTEADTIEVWPAASVLGAPNPITSIEVRISGSADGVLYVVLATVGFQIPAGAAPIAFGPLVQNVIGRFLRFEARDTSSPAASASNRLTITGRRRGV